MIIEKNEERKCKGTSLNILSACRSWTAEWQFRQCCPSPLPHTPLTSGTLGQNGGTGRQRERWKEGKKRQQNQLGKKIRLFLNGKQTKKYYIRIQILQEGEKLHSIKFVFFFVVVVVINNQIVTKQRIGVKAKPWQESQQSNETQVSEMSLWGVPPKYARHTGTRQPRYWHLKSNWKTGVDFTLAHFGF